MSVLQEGRRTSSARRTAPRKSEPGIHTPSFDFAIPLNDAASSAAEVLQSALARAVRNLLACDRRMRETQSAEAVHDARVAVRRLRSDLSTFIPLLDRAWARSLRDRLSDLDQVLGRMRSADVVLSKLTEIARRLNREQRAKAGAIFQVFRERKLVARESLEATLHDERYFQLLDALVAAARQPHWSQRAAEPAVNWVNELMTRVWRNTRKRVRAAQTPPSERDLHRIRLASKHLRYASETFAAVKGKRAARYACRVARLQTTLGEQHDAAEARMQLRAATFSADARDTAEELSLLLDAEASERRKKWRNAWKDLRKHRFWK